MKNIIKSKITTFFIIIVMIVVMMPNLVMATSINTITFTSSSGDNSGNGASGGTYSWDKYSQTLTLDNYNDENTGFTLPKNATIIIKGDENSVYSIYANNVNGNEILTINGEDNSTAKLNIVDVIDFNTGDLILKTGVYLSVKGYVNASNNDSALTIESGASLVCSGRVGVAASGGIDGNIVVAGTLKTYDTVATGQLSIKSNGIVEITNNNEYCHGLDLNAKDSALVVENGGNLDIKCNNGAAIVFKVNTDSIGDGFSSDNFIIAPNGYIPENIYIVTANTDFYESYFSFHDDPNGTITIYASTVYGALSNVLISSENVVYETSTLLTTNSANNSFVYGEDITLTAEVKSVQSGTIEGELTFTIKNGNATELSKTVLLVNGKAEYKIENSNITDRLDAGTYTIEAIFIPNENSKYKTSTDLKSFSITQKRLTATISDIVKKEYDTTETFTNVQLILNGVLDGDTVQSATVDANTSSSSVGTYTIENNTFIITNSGLISLSGENSENYILYGKDVTSGTAQICSNEVVATSTPETSDNSTVIIFVYLSISSLIAVISLYVYKRNFKK